MVQNQKVNICVHISTYNFARLEQSGYFLLPRTASILMLQLKPKLHQHTMKFHCVALFAKCNQSAKGTEMTDFLRNSRAS